ncbi:SUMF1/EgtB/PvdO family nonheme iron enzyme [Actinokineospora auranticolor]|uniref:Formylglycine-generating enzyme required for sulfatase activity n=1 Tax=Actinokineospora auranticolor TaxID=155976 RepID=A0A2S6H190_9PSEU|nr:SUMF1/EgtB/PvdO family nonheme iron enzyme [Actinokineospora auranticolor]PPK71190.1 formylglycine-generating enzyme required for sulfatase activity [Actinokineospora auranticolor]
MAEHRKFALVPFGERTLTVGSSDPSAGPAHEVTLDAFALADRCVSAGDFHAFLREAPQDVDHTMVDCIDPAFVVHRADGFALRPGCADFPMIQISFWAAAAYCNWLSRTEGREAVYDVTARTADLDLDGYRLPTEAEWEAACRAGAPDPAACNSADASPACRALRAGELGTGAFPPGSPGPVPVGSLPADGAGLHEMLGNLREWCHDRYGPYRSAPQRNPRGAQRGAFRVVRGGSFIDPAAELGPSSRLAAFEDTKCEVYGFRVAMPR